MCHKLSAIGKWGNDHKLIFKATMTSRMPFKAGATCQVLVVDQMARVIVNEHGLQSSPGKSMLDSSWCPSPLLKLVWLLESPWRLADAEIWWTMLHMP